MDGVRNFRSRPQLRSSQVPSPGPYNRNLQEVRDERPWGFGDKMSLVHDPQVPGTAVQVPGSSLRYPQLGTGMASSSHKMVASLAKMVASL